MGDLITSATGGRLYFAPGTAFDEVLSARVSSFERARLFADLARLNTLYMVARAGSGHLGSSFSSIDVVTWLHLYELRDEPGRGPVDLYFSSKGHDAPGLYSVLIGLGRLQFDLLHRLRRLHGLPGHPDVATPGMVTNTGSLGMGISKAKGMLFGRALAGKSGRIFVMTGDGELQEGQIWESLVSAANQRLSNLTVLVDHNQLQSDTFVEGTSALGDLEAKFQAFGWYAERVNGHDFEALGRALARVRAVTERPQVLILDTVKGRGVSFMEGVATDSDTALYRFHSGAPSASDYELAVAELLASLRAGYDAAGLPHPAVESIEQASIPQTGVRQSLIAAYSKALLGEMQRTPNAVVLDADLLVDTGQLPSKQAFPERHVECGIAEMDMVSQAGGMALEGALPICHSFACFLSARPNEQLYNNATERSKVVYVASLAGIVPGGPGHSHQGVRDISAIGAIPGLVLLEPATESDVEKALDFALHGTTESVYLRLVSVPWEVPESAALPALRPGVGHVARPGGDVVLFAYGPVLVAEALKAANDLVADGLDVGVVNLPWLNRVDDAWFGETICGARLLVFLDNHYEHGGQGDLLCAALAKSGVDGVRACKHGIREIPVSGTHAEVLAHHGLDAAGIARRVRSEL